jgi:hypothetical protein
MNQGRNLETEAEEEKEMVPQSEPEKQKPLGNNVRNQVKNKPQQQQVAQPQPEYQLRPEQHHISERAEGYRDLRYTRVSYQRPASQ